MTWSWSLEKIYGKCVADADPDQPQQPPCMLWQGGMAKKYPVLQEQDASRPHGQRQVHVRRKVFELAKGKPAPAGPRYVLVATCGKERCVAEGCLEVLTKAKRIRQVAAQGVFQTPAFRAAVAEGRRRNSDVDEATVAEIRASTEPGRVLAARHGLSPGYVYAIKRGQHRRDYRSPFAALVPVLQRS